MQASYHPLLVLISIVIAVVGAWVALSVLCYLSESSKQAQRRQILLGSVGFSAGTWAMHFVAMLAMKLPVEVAFDPLVTAISFLLALIGAVPAFWIVGVKTFEALRFVKASALLAAGICAMHYCGMSSMRMAPQIVYNPALVLLSAAIAGATSYGGLRLVHEWRRRRGHCASARAIGAVVLGVAVSAMHYTGMAAADFPEHSVSLALSNGLHGIPLARLVITSTLLLLLLVLLTSARSNQFAVWRVLAIIAVSEMVAMQILPAFVSEEMPKYLQEILDASILTILVFPVAWWINTAGTALADGKREVEANFQGQQALNRLLALPTMRMEMHEMLKKSLQIVLNISWLKVQPKGAIYLANPDRKTLSMAVHENLAPEVVKNCAQIDIGYCCCGQAAQQKRIQFHSGLDGAHEFLCTNMKSHGHYAVPLLSEGVLLGVLCLYHRAGRKTSNNEQIILEALGATIAGLIVQKRAEHELHLADTVFRHNLTCLMVTDENARILKVNPMFLAVTGYEEREIIGQTPAFLKSGRHDAVFYKAMWDRIDTDGKWEGEIWNQAKDGRIYPEWLNITAVRDKKGRTHNYVASFIDITSRKEAEARIEQLAYYDQLTSLANRTLFYSHLKKSLAEGLRNGTKVILMFIDLDRFKEINDTQGHDVGDELLKEVGNRLKAAIRESDILARLGGDEFVIILKDHLEDLSDAAKSARIVAEKIIAGIGEPYELRGQTFHCTASIGLVVYPEDGIHPRELLQRADTAMYASKKAGRGTYRFFSQTMFESIERRLRIERSLRKAIAYNELKLYYQPQIDIQTNQIVGAEALLRWEHEEYGEISPSEFVPLAEECGLIQPLGEWVFAEVCKQRAIWDSKGYEQLGHIALNISVHQLLSQQHLNRLSGVLTKSGVAAGKIELEITESGLARYPVATTDSIRALRKCGFKLAIDDFGTDYSSLSRLKSFDVHLLKIDQSFVRDMTVDSDDAAIVRAIIEMGHALGLTMLAEGVETREQLELLRQYGCRRCQGFYFGKPVSADEFEAVLRANKLVLAKAVDETPLAFDALDARKPTRLAS